jgi:hypothetical protein
MTAHSELVARLEGALRKAEEVIAANERAMAQRLIPVPETDAILRATATQPSDDGEKT